MKDPLDNPINLPDPTSVSPRPHAMRYGLIWALIGIMLGLVTHLSGMNDPSNQNVVMGILIWLLSTGIAVTMIVLAIKAHRQDLGGYIKFGRAFYTGFLTTLVSAIISTIWMIVFFTFIEPDLFEIMKEAMMEQWEEQQLSEAQIEQAQSFAFMFASPTAMVLMTLIGGLFWGSIISLIASAALKKEPPYQQMA